MKTDYNNINKFEVAIVSMIAVGFVILGITVFSSLTPRQQTQISSAFDILDMNDHVAASIEGVKFVYSIPEEFYDQFYIAFTEIVAWPAEDIELASTTFKELKRNVVSAFDTMTNQVVNGYAQQNQLMNQKKEVAILPHDGKVMGAVIEVTEVMGKAVVREKEVRTSLNMNYDYTPPKIEFMNTVLSYISP